MKQKVIDVVKAVLNEIMEHRYEKTVHNDYGFIEYKTKEGVLNILPRATLTYPSNNFTVIFFDKEGNEMLNQIVEPNRRIFRKWKLTKEEQDLMLLLFLSIMKNLKSLAVRDLEKLIIDYQYYINNIIDKLNKT